MHFTQFALPLTLRVEGTHAREKSKFFWFSSHLFVPLTFGRRYFRSEIKRKIDFSFAFRSLNRTFAR